MTYRREQHHTPQQGLPSIPPYRTIQHRRRIVPNLSFLCIPFLFVSVILIVGTTWFQSFHSWFHAFIHNDTNYEHSPFFLEMQVETAATKRQPHSRDRHPPTNIRKKKRHVLFIMVGSVRTLESTYTSIVQNLVQPLCPPHTCTSYLFTHLSSTDNRPDFQNHDPKGAIIGSNDTTINKKRDVPDSSPHNRFCHLLNIHPTFHVCEQISPWYNIGSQEEQDAMDVYEQDIANRGPNNNTNTYNRQLLIRVRSLRYGDPRRYSMWFARYWAWRFVASWTQSQHRTYTHSNRTAASKENEKRYEVMFLRPDSVWFLPFVTKEYMETYMNLKQDQDIIVHDNYYSTVPDTFAYMANVNTAHKYFSLEALVAKGVACLGGPQFNMSLAQERLLHENISVSSPQNQDSLPRMGIEWCKDEYDGWSEQILARKFIKTSLFAKYTPAGTSLLRHDGPDCKSLKVGWNLGWPNQHYSPVPLLTCRMIQSSASTLLQGPEFMQMIHNVRPYRIRSMLDNTSCLTLIDLNKDVLNGTLAPFPCQEHPVDDRQVFSSHSDSSSIYSMSNEISYYAISTNFTWLLLNHTVLVFEQEWRREYISLYTSKTLEPVLNKS